MRKVPVHPMLRSLAGTIAVVFAPALFAQASASTETLFRGIRVFDGERVIPSNDVLVRDGRIVRVGPNIAASPNARVVDGTGRTLLPGLIDSHTHTFGDASATALIFGVTTELDMFTDASLARTMREEQRSGKAVGRADLVSASTLVTAPGGHGTEYGMVIPTITQPESAQAFVDALIAEGSDYIKIIYDDGRAYGMSMPTISAATMRAVIQAAHRRNKLAVVHIGDQKSAKEAIDAGADGLVHLFLDSEPEQGFASVLAAKKAFAIPTLTVLLSVSGTPGAASVLDDSRLSPYITPGDAAILRQSFPPRANSPIRSYVAAENTVRQLKAAKVDILAGTDAGNPGTSHGAALHRELELLVKAGLTPSEALAAATSVPARRFGLNDRGRIAQGLRADLVMVSGNPIEDITATRAIEGIWKEGHEVDRASFAKRVADLSAAGSGAPRGSESGVVSGFDDGSISAQFGAGWAVTTDSMAGGGSSATHAVTQGGAAGTAGSLTISGVISGKVPYAWAGSMFSPGAQVFAPANLSNWKEVRFWVRGDGKTYRVMIFAQSKGFTPLFKTFVADPEWKEYVFPLSSFDGIDGRDIMSLMFVGGPTPGPFELQIDQVRFQ